MGSRRRGILRGMLLIGCAFAFGFAPPAQANTVYTYTGKAFTTFAEGFACPPKCAMKGSFTVAQPLGKNLKGYFVKPDSFSFTDGDATLSETNTRQNVTVIEVDTDSSGKIIRWYVDLYGSQPTGPLFQIISQYSINMDITELTDASKGDAYNNTPGAWTLHTAR